ncbi:response regulator [Rhodospirillum sp. A1_3_36]|uniref:response regulator n=1 Tax=Rhodospirillum sp. A1_3_36 TaxID=3391666 RepID=UPI0039A6C78D
MLLRTLLSALGAEHVLEAENAEEASKLLRRHPFDLAIVDHLLGGQTGLAWTHWVVHSPESPHQDLPVILISGHNDEHLPRAALAAGARGFIRKPFGARDLWIRVAQALSTKPSRRDKASRDASAGPVAQIALLAPHSP